MYIPCPLDNDVLLAAQSTTLSIEQKTEAEITRHVLTQAWRSQPLTIVAILLFSLLLYPAANTTWLLIWMGASLIILGTRTYALRRFMNNTYPDAVMPFWHKPLIVGALLSGGYWASLVGFAATIDDHAYERTIMILLCGAIAAGLSVLGAKRATFLAFSLPIIVTLVIYSVSMYGVMGLSIATLVLTFYLLILSSGNRYQTAMHTAISMRLKNHELIDQLAEARDRAETSSQVKGDFLTSMSHEIRTPMNGVSGILQILKDTKLDEEQQRFIDAGIRSSNRLMSLLNDVLDVSKIEAGALKLNDDVFDLPALCNEIIDLHRASALTKQLSLISMLDDNLPTTMTGDSYRIAQILNNLLGNAVKFTSQGFIEFSANQNTQGNELVFTILDTGCGIDSKKLNSIFNTFSQADKSITRKFGGSGLGLTISKQLVNLMNGYISVISNENGSEFCVHIPVVKTGVKQISASHVFTNTKSSPPAPSTTQ